MEWLPCFAPELNLIEAAWRDLKRHHLARRTFRDTDDLDQAIHQAIAALDKECTGLHSCRNLPKAA